MTMLEKAKELGAVILTNNYGAEWAENCPFDLGLEDERESRNFCPGHTCVECYARAYKEPKLDKATPQDAVDEPRGTVQSWTRRDILDQALRCVCGDREQDYGRPENNFETVAVLWSTYIRAARPESKDWAFNELDAKDVAAMLALLKIARIASGNAKADNWVDLAGYAACGGEIEMGGPA